MAGDRWSGVGGVGSEAPGCSALPSRRVAGGPENMGVSLGTGKLPLQGREGLDQLRGLECTATLANGDLDNHVCLHELTYRGDAVIVDRLGAPRPCLEPLKGPLLVAQRPTTDYSPNGVWCQGRNEGVGTHGFEEA